jgi:hypothetical protein
VERCEPQSAKALFKGIGTAIADSQMTIRADAAPSDLPEFIREVISIVGWNNWQSRIQGLRMLQKNNPFWLEFMRERYSLEIALVEARDHMQKTGGRCIWPARNAEELRLYAFVAMVAQVHRELSQHGKAKLAGGLRSGLVSESGLGSIAFEMRTVSHLIASGFAVSFHDLENDGGYDFLATSNGRKCEVECKYVSADIGRKIPRRKIYQLGELLVPAMRSAVNTKRGGYLLRVSIPDRLSGSREQQESLASCIQAALVREVCQEQETCSILIEPFDIDQSPFGERRGNFTKDEIRDRFCIANNIDNGNALIRWSPGKAAVAISFKSKKDDTVLEKILGNLKKDAKRQFTGMNPAFLLVHLADVSSKQLEEIAEADHSGKVTGIRMAISILLRDRPHIHTVALMTDGAVNVRHIDAGESHSIHTRETGPCYVFANRDHGQADDPVLSALFSKRQN